jgi:integrase
MENMRGVYERLKGSGIWWIRWTDLEGKKRREKVGQRSAAKSLLSIRKAQKLQEVKIPSFQKKKGLLFSELLDDALEHSKAENRERSTHELKLKLDRLRPDWGHRVAAEISKQELVRWLGSEMGHRDWTPATMNRWQACFSLVFRVAIDNGKLTTNPASRIRRKAEDNLSVRYLEKDEERRIRMALSARYSSCLPAFIISLNTGLRASEQWALKWADIDLDRNLLTVRRQKSGKGERHIQLNHAARCAFDDLRANPNEYGVPFLNAKGTPMTTHRDWFDPAVREAKVTDYSWHKNRHTFASRLAMVGVPMHAIAKLMGHSTIQMSMRYAHLSPDHAQSAVDKLDQF